MDSDTQTVGKTNKGWNRRKQARPGEILDAALKAFAEKGYAATRMEDIATRAGVTKGTIYLYFPGKEEVFKTLVREMVGQALANASRETRNSAATPRERLIQTLRAIADFLQSNERIIALPKIIISESGNFPELARFWRAEVIDKAIALIAEHLKQGAEAEEFRSLPSGDVAKLCIAPILLGIIWRTTFVPLDTATFDFDAFLSLHIDVLLHGLTPERGLS